MKDLLNDTADQTFLAANSRKKGLLKDVLMKVTSVVPVLRATPKVYFLPMGSGVVCIAWNA